MSKAILLFLFVVCIFTSTHCFAQKITPKAIETILNNSYKKLLKWDDSSRYVSNEAAEDSLLKQDSVFRTQLQRYTSKYPQTLNYGFDSLQSNIRIATSADKLLRIYSWDNWQGGTMHYFENVFQFKEGNRTYAYAVYDTSSDDEIYVPFYSDIYTLNANNKTYYLTIANGIYSSKDVSQSVKIFDIDNGRVNDVKLIKTPGHYTNEIDVYFDFFNVADRSDERPIRIIKYDSITRKIYIPIVTDDSDQKVTNKFIVYKFNGQYFEKEKAIFTANDAFYSK